MARKTQCLVKFSPQGFIIPGLFGKMSKGRLVKVTEDSDDLTASHAYGMRLVTDFKYTFDADRNATNLAITNSSYGKVPGKDLYHNWTTTTNYHN